MRALNLKVNVWPGVTGFKLAVLVKDMSASLLDVTSMDSVLLPGAGSSNGVLTLAVLLKIPATLATAVTVMGGMLLKFAPVYSARVQVMVLSQVHPVPAAETKVRPAPRVSVTVTG